MCRTQYWFHILTFAYVLGGFVCLFSWRHNPLWLYFHSPVADFSLLVFVVSWSHTTTHHSGKDSLGRVINPSQRPLPDNTQHSQQTNIHASGGIRTHNLSRRAAEDLCLRPRGHWDRLTRRVVFSNSKGLHVFLMGIFHYFSQFLLNFGIRGYGTSD